MLGDRATSNASGWTYGSLCVVCGTITKQGSTDDGDPYLHWWCKGEQTALERNAASQADEDRPW